MGDRLAGKRAVVTDCDAFMGPAITSLFREEGADVLADSRDLRPLESAQALIDEAQSVDILIVNLSISRPYDAPHETSDERWAEVFERLVHPMHRLVRAVLPQMIARRSGKIVVVGSAVGLRGRARSSSYAAARGAQHAYVKSAGIDAAAYNVQINATGQIFVENPTYFPPEYIASAELQDRLKEVPAGRLATGREAAAFVLFLSSAESDFICGQVFPYAGGWTV